MKKIIVCFCKNVDRETIIDATKAGADSLKKVQQATGACTGGLCLQLNPKKHAARQTLKNLSDNIPV